ncbi:MAG: patatin-like phospholipase family protein [Hyphomicrobiaceae bacterium]|nr:patatin-like phospholipase family protein [Hyphomicrobiaceae bacterium]
MFDAMVFAGGGNRCYWQGGFVEALRQEADLAPRLVVGASAGAFAASYSLLGVGAEVRAAVIGACETATRNFDWRAMIDGRPAFPVAGLYRQLMAETLTEARFAALAALTDLRIAVARPPAWLPLSLAITLGIGLYQVEKQLFAPVHPKGGRRLGFAPHFAAIRGMSGAGEMIEALMASASVPPIMPVGTVDGAPALDGGLVDNVPVDPVVDIERAGGRSLVLLTRPYRQVPTVAGRVYVQPSQRIPVGQFELTNPGGIRAAYELGLKDGGAFARLSR